MKLSDVAEVKVNFENADFWLVRSHGLKTVGQPVRIFKKDYVGIKIVRTDLVFPDYLFYVFVHLQSVGEFEKIAHGTLQLVHIRVGDIKNISLRMR